MTVKQIFAALSIAAVSMVSAHAEIPISEIYQVTVPDSLHVTGYQGLADVDGDGFGDLCFRSSSQVSAYSIAKDEQVAFLQIDADGNQRKFDGGFVDDDNLFDFAEAVFLGDSSRQTLYIVTRYGAEDHAPLDTVEVASYVDGHVRAIDSLFLRDMDGDGQEELYGRHVYGVFIEDWNYQPGYWEYYYQAFVYNCALETFTLLGDVPMNFRGRYDLDGKGELAAVWIEEYSYYQPISHGSGSTTEQWFAMFVARNDSSTLRAGFANAYGPGCPANTVYANRWEYASLKTLLVGDFLSVSPGWEALLEISYTATLSDIDTSCTNSFQRLVYLDLSSPDSLPRIYDSMPYEGIGFGPGFTDEAYPDRFFTAGNGRFYLVDPGNLARIDSTEAMFPGSAFVDYTAIEPGGTRMALFRKNWAFRLYSLDVATDVPGPDAPSLPVSFKLGQPYPNPFNAELTVPIELSRKGKLRVEVYDVLGRQVETLYDDYASRGQMSLPWEAGDYASGVYLIKATTGSSVQTAKVVLLK